MVKTAPNRVKNFLDSGKEKIFSLVKAEPHLLDKLLTEATNEQLWRLEAIFRDAEIWYREKFLRALMALSMEMWERHELIPEMAFARFNRAEDVETIVRIYKETGHASPILFELNYNLYWVNWVKKILAEEGPQAARESLEWARHGLICGKPVHNIPTQINDVCLTDLTALINTWSQTRE